MKKLILASVLMGIVLLCSGQQAQASSVSKKDDNVTLKKVVHVLDDVINNDYNRTKKIVVCRKPHITRKVCFYRRHHKVCKIVGRGYAKNMSSPHRGGHY